MLSRLIRLAPRRAPSRPVTDLFPPLRERSAPLAWRVLPGLYNAVEFQSPTSLTWTVRTPSAKPTEIIALPRSCRKAASGDGEEVFTPSTRYVRRRLPFIPNQHRPGETKQPGNTSRKGNIFLDMFRKHGAITAPLFPLVLPILGRGPQPRDTMESVSAMVESSCARFSKVAMKINFYLITTPASKRIN